MLCFTSCVGTCQIYLVPKVLQVRLAAACCKRAGMKRSKLRQANEDSKLPFCLTPTRQLAAAKAASRAWMTAVAADGSGGVPLGPTTRASLSGWIVLLATKSSSARAATTVLYRQFFVAKIIHHCCENCCTSDPGEVFWCGLKTTICVVPWFSNQDWCFLAVCCKLRNNLCVQRATVCLTSAVSASTASLL